MSTPEMEREAADVADSSPPTRPRPRSWRPLIMRLHFYAGILIAPFILVATVSGGLYAIAPTVEKFVYSDYLQVDSTGPALPLSQQVDVARAERPDLALAAVRPATDAGETTRVYFTDPSLGESERLAVFVDPVTGTSVGELATYGSSSALPLRTWIDQLHRSLHLGDVGRLYSELAASWLWVIALGGVYLWFDRYRRARRQNPDRARLFTVNTSASGRTRTLGWHGVAGIWIAVGLVFLSATGLTWSTYAGQNVTDLRAAFSWSTPAVGKSLSGAEAMGGGEHAAHGHAHTTSSSEVTDTVVPQIDSVLDTARTQGITGKVEIAVPAEADTAFVVSETRQPWVLENNAISIDGGTGAVIDTVWFADWPLAAKLASWGVQLHMGTLFGLANQLALVALAVALTTVIVRGYRMWWMRRPTSAPRIAAGRPPARGGVRRISPVAAVVAVVVTVAVGWFVPLLGLSLLAFLVVDAALGATRSFSRKTAR